MMLSNNAMPVEARRYLMRVAFLGMSPVQRFWIGLAETPEPGVELDLDVISQWEPAGGYGRQSVDRQDWTLDSDGILVSPEVFFTNLSGERWRPLDMAFLATTPDRAGVLLAWGMLSDGPYTLNPRNQLHFPFRLAFE